MAETNIRPVERLPGASPEILRVPESTTEGQPETPSRPESISDSSSEQPVLTTPAKPVTASPVESVSLFVQEIEQVMTEGLGETYKTLAPEVQTRFKITGEQTARTIAGLLEQTKVQARKVVELLVAWLRIIPGVNKFFLEQEAKIKADKLLALRRPPQ